MELRHLRYFVAVAEELSFTRAAERLHITQPPLTRIIQDLEAELGTALFERNRRQIMLTPAGEAFLDQTYTILENCDDAIQTARRVSRGEVGKVSVGFSETVICSVLPDIVRIYEERFPGVQVRLHNMTPLRVRSYMRALQERRLDIAIAAVPPREHGIASQSVLSYPMMVALPTSHPCAHLELLPLTALAGETWIWFPRHLNPHQYELCLRLCRQAGFEPRAVRPISSVHVGLSLVAAGRGLAMASAALQRIQWQGVVYRPIEPTASLDFYMMWREEETSPPVLTFMSVVQEIISTKGAS